MATQNSTPSCARRGSGNTPSNTVPHGQEAGPAQMPIRCRVGEPRVVDLREPQAWSGDLPCSKSMTWAECDPFCLGRASEVDFPRFPRNLGLAAVPRPHSTGSSMHIKPVMVYRLMLFPTDPCFFDSVALHFAVKVTPAQGKPDTASHLKTDTPRESVGRSLFPTNHFLTRKMKRGRWR